MMIIFQFAKVRQKIGTDKEIVPQIKHDRVFKKDDGLFMTYGFIPKRCMKFM